MIRMSDYIEATLHGKIYTSCFDSASIVKRNNSPYLLVAPIRGEAWKKHLPNRVKASDFRIMPKLAPTRRLETSFRRKLLGVDEFEMTYALEMESEKCVALIDELAEVSLSNQCVVIFGKASKGRPCHRYMLGKLVARAVIKNSTSRHRAKLKAYAGELSI